MKEWENYSNFAPIMRRNAADSVFERRTLDGLLYEA